ncbi:MAG: PDZ domain-containing protein [Polaribacter sp.]|nr:PDZ domain-containing protein [Polaribacter sp.]
MSGLDIVYNGKQLVKEEEVQDFTDAYNQNIESINSVSFITNFSYKFKSSYKIKSVLKDSPAAISGLLKNDVILKINGKNAYEFSLGEIVQKFKEKDRKKIRMVIDRDGKKMKFQFRLEKKV